MTLLGYLGRRKGEFLLVLISAWAVTSVALNGFFLDGLAETSGYAGRLGIALALDIVLCLVLYVASFDRSKRVLGIIGFLAVVAVLGAVAMALSTGAELYADAEGNYVYLVIVAAFSCAGCFLLTRTLAGSMVWFVAAAFVCSLIQAFYQSNEYVLSMVAIVSALALVVYGNYRKGLEGAEVASQWSPRFSLPTSLMLSLLCVGGALGVWFLIIAPLNPGVLNIKLFTEYRQLPIEEHMGTADELPTLTYDYTSQNLVDGQMYTTDDLQEDASASKEVDAASALEKQETVAQQGSGSGGSAGGGSQMDLDEQSDDAVYSAIDYVDEFPWVIVYIIIAVCVILLIVALFLLRRYLRERRLRKYLALDPRNQVIKTFRFLQERLRRLGFVQPDGMTLREFAASSTHQMDMITEETRVSYRKLSETYMAAVYGECEPTEDEIVEFAAYYLRFWKAARTYLGNVKYFFKSFRL